MAGKSPRQNRGGAAHHIATLDSPLRPSGLFTMSSLRRSSRGATVAATAAADAWEASHSPKKEAPVAAAEAQEATGLTAIEARRLANIQRNQAVRYTARWMIR